MKNSVSIITLSYNSGDKLYESVASALKQDYPDIELIVADDGSKDFDIDKLRGFIHENNEKSFDYQIIVNSKNVGTVKNMNNAVACSKGNLIINLSAGDIFTDETVVSQICTEYDKTGCDWLFTRRQAYDGEVENTTEYIPSDYEIIQIQKLKTIEQEYADLYTADHNNMISGCVLSCRREVMDKMGCYDENYFLLEDLPFIAKMVREGNRINYNYDIVSIYYQLGGVSTGVISPLLRKDMCQFMKSGLEQRDRIKGFNRRKLAYKYYKYLRGFDSSLYMIVLRLLFADVIIYRAYQNIVRKIVSR